LHNECLSPNEPQTKGVLCATTWCNNYVVVGIKKPTNWANFNMNNCGARNMHDTWVLNGQMSTCYTNTIWHTMNIWCNKPNIQTLLQDAWLLDQPIKLSYHHHQLGWSKVMLLFTSCNPSSFSLDLPFYKITSRLNHLQFYL
jgi:hypothetical protein